MASRNVSPGGALLRASRVFSIPQQLPKPLPEIDSMSYRGSNTATLPHPVLLSITTPDSSRRRGDWGFKRALPLRSTTKSSTPLIRVETIDSWERVTEYASSADHTLSLKKWQEMDVPIFTPQVHKPGQLSNPAAPRSVFEDEIDKTTPPEGGFHNDDVRWKFKGPWFASQTEGEFADFVAKDVRKRKGEFNDFLRASCATAMATEKKLAATGEVEAPIEASDVTDAQFLEYIRSLRQERTELFRLIRKFLDMPPLPHRRMSDNSNFLQDVLFREDALKDTSGIVSMSPYAESGPPKTHPSAGLAYSRSSAYLQNHPEFGPQREKTPVQARVVMPKAANVGNFPPILGVGGFATAVPAGFGSFDNSRSRGRSSSASPAIPGLNNIELGKKGGSKTYVHPKTATVDSRGKIILTVTPADGEAIAVAEGTTDQIPTSPTRGPISPFSVDRSWTNTFKQPAASSTGGEDRAPTSRPAPPEWGLGSTSRPASSKRDSNAAELEQLLGGSK